MTDKKPTFTHEGVTYTELSLWKAKTEANTFFVPAFVEAQIYDFAEKDGITIVSIEKANDDEATAYQEGFYEGLAVGKRPSTEEPTATVLG
jgi:hypothetical protein